MGMEDNFLKKAEKQPMELSAVSELEYKIGHALLDNGVLKKITSANTEPDGGVRIVIQGGNPRYFERDEVSQQIELTADKID